MKIVNSSTNIVIGPFSFPKNSLDITRVDTSIVLISAAGSGKEILRDDFSNFVDSTGTPYTTVEACIADLSNSFLTPGTGSVSSFSANNFSPLFTTSVTDPTVNPTLSFTAVDQSANTVYAGPSSGGIAAPTFRSLVLSDIPNLGTIYLPIEGGTLTGSLILNADATNPLGAVTLQQLNNTIVGIFELQQGYDASSNTFPTAANTNPLVGTIEKGFVWNITVAGTLGGISVEAGDALTALVDNPGQVSSNWLITEFDLGFTPVSDVLNSGRIFVGNASNTATGVDITGDWIINNIGVVTLVTVNSNVGSFGDSTHVSSFTVNGKGLVTAASSTAIVFPVTSVFTRIGNITAQNGDYNTSQVTENTNLYYTQARFDSAFAAKTTTNLAEGSNLYFTNIRAIGAILIGYVSGAGTISSTDSILSAIQKLNGNITTIVSGVSSVSGTVNRITTTPTSGAVVVDIAISYVGQSSINTVGTITTGTWSGLFGTVTGANLTNLTAANISAGIAGINITGNSATVTTNADLTGVITSVGNATSIAAQTGTGTKFVVDTSPTLITPVLGVASATSLGIGTTTPSGILEVVGTTAGQDIIVSRYSSDNVSGAFISRKSRGTVISPAAILSGDNISVIGGRGYDGTLMTTTNNGSAIFTAAENWTATAHGTYYAIGTTPVTTTTKLERLRILDSGFVGIGTTTPLGILNVVNITSTVMRGGIFDQYSADTLSSRITARKSRGTLLSPVVIVTADSLGSFAAFGYDGTNFIEAGSMIIQSTGTISSGIVPGKIIFSTATFSGTLTVAHTIDQLQNSLFNGAVTISPIASTGTPLGALTVNAAAHTALTASTEFNSFQYNAASQQFATGALTTERFAVINNPTYTFVGASTITNAATFAIAGSPIAGTNATITNNYSLWVQAGETYLAGSLRFNYVQVSATYAILSTDNIIEATTGTFTVTLPTAVNCKGRRYTIENSGTGFITLNTTSAQTINGVASVIFGQYVSYTVVSNGTNWVIM